MRHGDPPSRAPIYLPFALFLPGVAVVHVVVVVTHDGGRLAELLTLTVLLLREEVGVLEGHLDHGAEERVLLVYSKGGKHGESSGMIDDIMYKQPDWWMFHTCNQLISRRKHCISYHLTVRIQ